jgi:hypothetical protein
MKGVIWKIENQKSICLLTNGDFRTIPSPQDAEIGMVLNFSYNKKLIVLLAAILGCIIAVGIIALSLIFRPVSFIDITYGQKNSQYVAEAQVNRYGYVLNSYVFSSETPTAFITDETFVRYQKYYRRFIRAAVLSEKPTRHTVKIVLRIASSSKDRASGIEKELLGMTVKLEAETGHKLKIESNLFSF